jgi:hypothetical protein
MEKALVKEGFFLAMRRRNDGACSGNHPRVSEGT